MSHIFVYISLTFTMNSFSIYAASLLGKKWQTDNKEDFLLCPTSVRFLLTGGIEKKKYVQFSDLFSLIHLSESSNLSYLCAGALTLIMF